MDNQDKNRNKENRLNNERKGRSESWNRDKKTEGRPEKSAKRRFKKPKLEPIEVNPNPRLNKYIANAGIVSRRKADELIRDGFVMVNDEVVVAMGYRVQPDDVIKYRGEIVTPETRKVYILINKPKNTITTAIDPQGRRTVLDLVKDACEERVYPVGRLDRYTTGLLLITNDGDIAKKLSHPSYNVKKIYHVTLDKDVSPAHLEEISSGLELEDGFAEVDSVSYANNKKNEIGVEIHIGKNRIVRRIFAHLGYEVLRLDRVYYAGLTKKDIPRGMYRFLTEQEVLLLKHFT